MHDNPADFALDVLIKASETSENIEKLYRFYTENSRNQLTNLPMELTNEESALERHRRREKGMPARSFWKETYLISQRTIKNAFVNPAVFTSQVIVAIVLGLIVGLVFYNMSKTVDPGVQNRLGAIFFIVVSQVFSTLTALEPLIKERALFLHVSFVFLYCKYYTIIYSVGACKWLLSNSDVFHLKTFM